MIEPFRPDAGRPVACDGTDAARGILASTVFVSHFAQIFVGDEATLGVAPTLAVLFFFAISGFVISASLVRHTSPGGTVDLPSFAKKRFFRIMPPLMTTFLLILGLEVALTVSGVLGREPGDNYHLSLFKVGVSLLTVGAVGDLGGSVDGPLWSLRYEIRCYLTAGLIAWLISSRATGLRKTVLLTGLCAYWFVAMFIKNEGPISQLPWLLSFAAGFLVFCYRGAVAGAGRRIIAPTIALTVLGSVVAAGASWAGHWHLLILSLCVCGCAFAPLVLALHEVRVGSRALATLAGVSYTLYIAHFPVLLALHLFIKAAPASMYAPLAAAAAVVAAIICFALGRLTERPSAQLAWTERQFARVRSAIAVKVPQA